MESRTDRRVRVLLSPICRCIGVNRREALALRRARPGLSGAATSSRRGRHDQRSDRLQGRGHRHRPAVAVGIPSARGGARPQVEDPADRRLDGEGETEIGKKLKAREQLSAYEMHLMVDVLTLHAKPGA